MAKRPKKAKAPEKRGPKPEVLKLPGEWEDAVAEAVKRPPPKPRSP